MQERLGGGELGDRLGLALGLAVAVGLAIPASALGAPPHNYDSNPGRTQATEVGAQCDSGAGSGAFGAFGNFGEYGDNFAGGADGQQTGRNNAAVCGNRQGNLD